MFLFFFFIIDFFFLAVVVQISDPIAELVISIKIQGKEVKAEIEMYPVTTEAKLRKCFI